MALVGVVIRDPETGPSHPKTLPMKLEAEGVPLEYTITLAVEAVMVSTLRRIVEQST